MILLIDNYDSFTYNLYQLLSELGAEIIVKRNDQTSINEIQQLAPEKIVISPGAPSGAGLSNQIIQEFGPVTPILGVCLGHQCIGAVYGATIVGAGEIMHGKTSLVHHDSKGVFTNLPNPLEAIRYHSLAVQPENIPVTLEVTAWTENGVIMGLRHKNHPVEGIQFHPESIKTQSGKSLLENFLTQ